MSVNLLKQVKSLSMQLHACICSAKHSLPQLGACSSTTLKSYRVVHAIVSYVVSSLYKPYVITDLLDLLGFILHEQVLASLG